MDIISGLSEKILQPYIFLHIKNEPNKIGWVSKW